MRAYPKYTTCCPGAVFGPLLPLSDIPHLASPLESRFFWHRETFRYIQARSDDLLSVKRSFLFAPRMVSSRSTSPLAGLLLRVGGYGGGLTRTFADADAYWLVKILLVRS